jgi:vanillate O-demethylase ferredoxin subunit
MTARIIMKLVVDGIDDDTTDVKLVTVRHPLRPELPPVRPGDHVDVHLPQGKIRQYSVCTPDGESGRWRIAIKRSDAGRGGSTWLHSNLRVGMALPVSAPRSNFRLVDGAKRHVFVAGGIGITPFLSMVRHARAADEDFVLHYAAPSRAQAPLLRELEALCAPGQLRLWLSREDGGRRFDADVIGPPQDGQHVYCCGPAGLVEAVRTATAEWPAGQAHFEVFQPTLDENFKPEPFDIRIASTGDVLRVAADESALDALRRHGHVVPTSCGIGVCGTCACGYTAGTIIHRDSFLDATARQEKMALCVSRARVAVTVDL